MNKKLLIIFFLFLIFVFYITAQEEAPRYTNRRTAFSYGVDINLNSSSGFAYGAVLGADFYFLNKSAFGFQLTASSDGDSNNVIEPSLAFRHYFTDLYSIYLQLDSGVSIITETGQVRFNLLLGLRTGYRLHITEIFFIEPFIRGGYPYIAGGGFILGYRK
ncbi:MAG: hypothetical protein FWC21_00665 [Treponema sp.]|nr:hypothetical protein [Treponema sp.]